MGMTYKSQGAGASTETSGAALSPLCPATVDAGDILVAHVFWEGTATAPSTPANWTLLHGPEVIESTIARHWVFGKIADGTEDAGAVAFGAPAVTTQRAARVYSFAGRTSGTIAQLVKGFAATSHATDPAMPTVTTTQAGGLAVALVAQNDNNAFASPTGESGGDWIEAVAEYTVALTPGLSLGIETATPTSDPGTISGGSMATTNDPCGVIGFQIIAAPDSIIESNSETVSLTEAHAEVVSKTRGDSVALTEAHTEVVSKTRGETVSLSEGLSAVRVLIRAYNDTASFVEGFARRVNKALADTVALTESRLLTVSKRAAETLGLTEGFAAVRVLLRNLPETVLWVESISIRALKRFAETLGLTEQLSAVFMPGSSGAIPPQTSSISIRIGIG